MSQSKIYQLKGELSTMMVLYLRGIDLKLLEDELSRQVDSSPQLFKGIPIIVDLSAIKVGNSLDLKWLKNLLLTKDLVPVGLRNVNEDLASKAGNAGWALLAGNSGRAREIESSMTDAVALPSKSEVSIQESQQESSLQEDCPPIETTMHVQQVRSGQQLTVSQGDLVVINSVNEGAELLVDGNIHVYGTLRGRALAGIHGNRSARIFCQSLEAELVAIAGFYRMQEDIPSELRGKTVQIYLDQDELKIEQLIK